MKDRKFHINKQLNDDYPSPGVPVDEAWAQMNTMLDAHIPKPIEPTDNHKLPEGNNFLKLAALLIAAIIIILLVNRINKQPVKIPGDKIHSTSINKKDAGVLKMPDTQENVNKTTVNSNNDDNQTNRVITPPLATGNTLSGGMNKAHSNFIERQASSLHGKAINSKNIAHNNTGNYNIPGRDTRNNTSGNNNGNPRDRIGTYHNNKGLTSGNDMPVINSQYYNVSNERVQSLKTNDAFGIEITDRLALPLDTSLVSLVTPETLAISLEQQLRDSLYAIAYAKKGQGGMHEKSNTAIAKMLTGFSYGFQWEVPVPLQGTAYYSRGTNGVSKPYNVLVPQLWLSKSLGNKSSLILILNFNQQYFINNKKLSELTYFLAPRDSIISSKSLYKTGGFGGTISYSHNIYKRWSGALGINYTLNRTALIDKKGINTYTGAKISDSLYRIDRHSLDWQYISKSILSVRLELYYGFRKFNLGASANLPLSTPVYDNKKNHPVNAQLFIRWKLAGQ